MSEFLQLYRDRIPGSADVTRELAMFCRDIDERELIAEVLRDILGFYRAGARRDEFGLKQLLEERNKKAKRDPDYGPLHNIVSDYANRMYHALVQERISDAGICFAGIAGRLNFVLNLINHAEPEKPVSSTKTKRHNFKVIIGGKE